MVATAALLLAALIGTENAQSPDYLGSRFVCPVDTYAKGCIRLSVLREDCELRVAYHGGVPAEPNDKLVLTCAGTTMSEVGRVEDLARAVRVSSPDDALELIRFGSSYRTVHYFTDQVLEIFPGKCDFVCLDNEWWASIGAQPALAESQETGFRVIRTVARMRPESRWLIEISVREEFVECDGEVTLRWEAPIGCWDSSDIGVRFPFFM